MKTKFVVPILFALSQVTTAYSQLKIPSCPLDSSDFSKPTQPKMWRIDTLQVIDVEHRINYLSALHRNYLPLHLMLKNKVKQFLNDRESDALNSLDSLYRSELSRKRNVFLGGTPGFNENLPIFTHLNFVVIFETMGFYPDVYVVFFNMILPPPTITKFANKKIEIIYSSTKRRFKEKTDSEFQSFLEGMQTLREKEHCWLFGQGTVSPEEREKYEWINFLLWCNRTY
jgi:hypothetical protein